MDLMSFTIFCHHEIYLIIFRHQRKKYGISWIFAKSKWHVLTLSTSFLINVHHRREKYRISLSVRLIQKSHVTSLWRQYDVITQKWCRPGPKIGKITKRNIENQEKIAWWWLTPLFLYFHELFQKKIVSLTFNTNKASKSVKNENHNFRLPPTTSPYFPYLTPPQPD